MDTTKAGTVTSPKFRQAILHVGDSLLCCLVFFPSMVLYWRGIWDLWGVYIFHGQSPKQQWVLLTISLTSVFGYIAAPLLDKYLDRGKRILYFVVSRGYSYIYAALNMCYWRAVWTLGDYYLPADMGSSAVNLACTYIPLLLFRVSRCCIFPPMLTCLDTRDDFLKVSPRFKTKPFTALYIPDVLFSSIIVQGLNILTWRGLWNFLGSFIFPDDPQFSDLFCLGLGYGLILTVFLLEEPLAFVTLWMNEKGFYFKLIWEDIVYTTIFFCSAILWRGGWNLTAAYVFPDPQMGGWFCFSVGTFLMTTAQIFSLVGAHGVTVDGGEVGRDGIFPTKYLRIYCNGQEPLEPEDTEKSPVEKFELSSAATIVQHGVSVIPP